MVDEAVKNVMRKLIEDDIENDRKNGLDVSGRNVDSMLKASLEKYARHRVKMEDEKKSKEEEKNDMWGELQKVKEMFIQSIHTKNYSMSTASASIFDKICSRITFKDDKLEKESTIIKEMMSKYGFH